MSLLLKTRTCPILFKKNLGKIAAPIKKNKNAMINVSVKLAETGVRDSNKNAAKTTSTINGLKI